MRGRIVPEEPRTLTQEHKACIEFERSLRVHPNELLKTAGEAITVTLNLLDRYDKRLIDLGDPVEIVYSSTYLATKDRLRALVEELERP